MIDIIQILGFACLGHLITDFISSFDLPELPELIGNTLVPLAPIHSVF